MSKWVIKSSNDELMHYSSQYYDPVKAHEYYEEHKQLKGRTSTAGISKEGREVASYVKKSITDEKKKNIEEEKTKRDSDIETYKNQMASKISLLQDKLNAMSPANKKANALRFKRMIQDLRDENAEKRKELNVEYKTNSEKIKTDSDEKYISELDRIRSEYPAAKKGTKQASANSGSGIKTATTSKERNEIMKNIAKKK